KSGAVLRPLAAAALALCTGAVLADTVIDNNGSETVSGINWDAGGRLTVGQLGSANLFINNGGTVTSTSAVIGEAFGSLGWVDVSGVGSRWMNIGGFNVGLFGIAVLRIMNGASVIT